MPHHETALDWFQRCRRHRQQQQQQQLYQQQHPHHQSSFSQLLHELLFLKSHHPHIHQNIHGPAFSATTTTTPLTTTATTTGSTSNHHDHAPMIVLEGCSMAKSWIMIHLIQQWVTTTPYSVLVINGETRIQLGLLPLLLMSNTGRSSSSTTNNNNDQPCIHSITNHYSTPSTPMGGDQQQQGNNTTKESAAQDYMQRIHFGMGSVALLELVRYSCASAAAGGGATNNNTSATESLSSSSSPTTTTTATPLLLVWDDYPDDPEITRQFGRMIQSFPQLLSVVVAGKWSGGMAQRIQVERLKGESWMATVAGKRYEFRIGIEGICC